VAADPPPVPGADQPGGWPGFVYYRLHGSPRIYYSPYETPFLARLAEQVQNFPTPAWIIFDNTAYGFAAANALELVERTRRT
jgi:uncharacterized protein YecE (DUF72 family)